MPVTDAQVKVAIDELKGGSAGAVRTLTLMVVRDRCAYDQFRQIAAALYGILDDEHLDRAKKKQGQ